MKTAIIFGVNGQDGYYLNELLRLKNIDVIGISRSGNWIHADAGNYEEVKRVIKQHKPDYVFHLAANSSTRHDVLFENHSTISTGTFNILEAVRLFSPDARVFLSGSGLQFKNTGNPIKETDPFEATSPYAVSRIQSVYAGRYYRSRGLRVYFGYFFNHESPMRPERHMSKKITSAVQRIAEGSNEKIEIGDISVKKEWTFAGDVVKGIFTLVEQDKVFEATIGSGEAYSIEEWLRECFELVQKNWTDYVIEKRDFTPEYQILYSDPSTIFSLGWKPEVSFSALAKIMMRRK
jgi:GDPmannose 4,6-dehydratase